MSNEQENSIALGCPSAPANVVCPPPPKRKRVYSYKYCTHCSQNVSKSTYYQHKALLIAEASCSSSTESSDNETQPQVDFSQSQTNDDDSASQMPGTKWYSKLNSTFNTCVILGQDEVQGLGDIDSDFYGIQLDDGDQIHDTLEEVYIV